MKGTMKARLVDVSTNDNSMTMTVSNLDDKRHDEFGDIIENEQSFAVKGIAIKKVAEISSLLAEENDIILTLELIDNLSVVEDLSAKINGIQINFDTIDDHAAEQSQKLEQQEIKKEQGQSIVWQAFAIFFIFIIVIGIINSIP